MKKKYTWLCVFVLFAALCSAETTLTGRVQVWIDHTYENEGGLGTTRDSNQIRADQQFAAGTSSSSAQVDLLWYGQRDLASGTSEEIDFAGGITNAFGTTITFARIKALHIHNTSATQTLTIGNAAAPWAGPFSPATATFSLPPYAFLAWQAPYTGWAVAAGTGDCLKVSNPSGATATYNIWVIGASE